MSFGDRIPSTDKWTVLESLAGNMIPLGPGDVVVARRFVMNVDVTENIL